ncbi:MAG TPA: TlpA disulfide reductase family protein [Mycobacteriales bacterium]
MSRRPRRAALVVAAALAALGIAACSSTTTTQGPAGNGDGFIAGSAGGGELSTRVPAPALSGPSVTGQGTLSLAQYVGKVVVVNFYASWCSPCRAETPILVAAAEAHPTVQFLGVLFEDTPANGLAFRRSFGVTYPSIVDRNGVDLAKFKNVNPSAVPDTFVIDKSGKIAAKYVGGLKDAAAFGAVLTRLEAEPA